MKLSDLVQNDLGLGIGLRSVHYSHITNETPDIDWFEILSENYMNTGGRPLHFLDQVAERYPVGMHGVSMNIGSIDPLDHDYLHELKALRDRVNARLVSDHLCWTGVDGENLHDLLPMPYTEESLRHLVARIREVQDVLEMPLILENPSTYLEFEHSELPEPEFLAAMARESGCGLLLDVNNVFVCASNHGFDAADYLRRLPWDHVVYFHLAGHSDLGTHRLDTHDGPVCDEVWELYDLAHQLSGGRSTLMEWDASIPTFEEVHGEVLKAQRYRQQKGYRQQTGYREQEART